MNFLVTIPHFIREINYQSLEWI